MNLWVENASTHRFPVGAKNLSPSYPFRPSFLSCQRHESSGRKRILPNKNINLGEVAHLPPCIVATGGKAAPCRIFVCGYAFLQIVARLRHAVFCHDQRFRPHFFRASQILFRYIPQKPPPDCSEWRFSLPVFLHMVDAAQPFILPCAAISSRF